MSAKSPSAAPAPESPNAPPPAAGSPPPPPPPASSTNSSSPPPPSSGNSPPPPPNSEAPAPTPSSKNSPPTPPPPPSSPPPPGTTLRPLAPPPPKMRPPPRSSQGKSPPSSNSGSSGDNGGLSTPAIIGIAVGGFVVVALILMLLACCCCRKRKKKESYPSYEITDDPPMPSKSNEYYAGGVQYQQARYQPSDAHINQPPPSAAPPAVTNHNRPSSATNHNPPSSGLAGGPSQTFSSGSFVPLPPPPPPPLFSSSEDSSNFSGLKRPMPHPPPSLARTMFTYDELSRATNGFSNANVLGQGGFGSVFKGVLPNGQTVAVKQLKSGSRQGEREFQSEVEIITRVHHRHLVSLIGYCIAGRQRLLVYEFVDNNTLDYHLHTEGLPVMDWPTRLKIAIGAARGLAYLHEGCSPMIIHRDIKSSNILLDSHFEAKVADFGLAKIASEGFTHISTRVMGTFGYLAPEYASSGKLTEKSDVFSFGIVLLELITGRKPVDVNQRTMEDSLVDWARPLLLESLRNTFPEEELVDPRLDGDYDESEMMRVIACAASAVRLSAKKRPRIGQIVRVLEGDVSLKDLHNGDRPGHSTIYSPGSSDYDINQYREDMRNLRRVALGTHEYAGSTGEFSETSDYGQIPSASSSDNLHERDLPNRNGAGR